MIDLGNDQYQIQNKQTGETRIVHSADLGNYGLSAPTPKNTIPNVGKGDFQSPLPGGSTAQPQQPNAVVDLMNLLAPKTVSAIKKATSGQIRIGADPAHSTKGDLGASVKGALGDTANLAKAAIPAGVEMAQYNPAAMEGAILPRMGINAGLGAAGAASDPNADATHIGVATLLSALTPEAARGAMHVGHEGMAKILNDLVEKQARKSTTAFPVAELFKQLEERVPKAEGNIQNMMNVVDTMKSEAGLDTPGEKLYKGSTMNDKRKLFNKSFTGNTNLDTAQNTMAQIIREHQVADNPLIGKLLPAQKLLTYDLPGILDAAGSFGKPVRKALSLTGSGIHHLVPGPSSTIGELLQNLSRVGAQNLPNAYQQ